MNPSFSATRLSLHVFLASLTALATGCGSGKTAPAAAPFESKELEPITSFEGAMQRCPNPLAGALPGAQPVSYKALFDGQRTGYHLVRVRHYMAGALYQPAGNGKAEVRSAGAFAVTYQRRSSIGTVPKKADFDFTIGCQQFSDQGHFSGSLSAPLSLDREDGYSRGQFEAKFSREGKAPFVQDFALNLTKTAVNLDETPRAGVVFQAYRLERGGISLVISNDAKEGDRSHLFFQSEYTLEEGAPSSPSLPEYVDFFENLRNPRDYAYLFPGPQAVEQARVAFEAGMRLPRLTKTMKWVQALRDPVSYEYLYSGKGGARLALDLIRHDVDLVQLAEKVSYYQDSHSRVDHSRNFPGVAAVGEAFKEMRIPLRADAYKQ